MEKPKPMCEHSSSREIKMWMDLQCIVCTECGTKRPVGICKECGKLEALHDPGTEGYWCKECERMTPLPKEVKRQLEILAQAAYILREVVSDNDDDLEEECAAIDLTDRIH